MHFHISRHGKSPTESTSPGPRPSLLPGRSLPIGAARDAFSRSQRPKPAELKKLVGLLEMKEGPVLKRGDRWLMDFCGRFEPSESLTKQWLAPSPAWIRLKASLQFTRSSCNKDLAT